MFDCAYVIFFVSYFCDRHSLCSDWLIYLRPSGRNRKPFISHYDTIRNTILTYAQKLARVSLIYRTEPSVQRICEGPIESVQFLICNL